MSPRVLVAGSLALCLACGSSTSPVVEDTPDAGPDGAFQEFVLAFGGGFCVRDDCSGSIRLTNEAMLSVDRFGEFPIIVHQADVSPDDFAAAVPALTDPALVALLSGPLLPCGIVPDSAVSMELVLDDAVPRLQGVTACEDPAIEAARTMMVNLAETYGPTPFFVH